MLGQIRLMFEKTTRPNRRQRYLLENAMIQLLHEQADLERWNDLIRTHHYLRNANVAGKALRYVVEVGGKWAALLSFSSAAYHLKARDSCIGWEAWQRRQRLELLVANSRFLILGPSRSMPNLASKSLSLALKRLPEDWRGAFGAEPVAVETFVDPEFFEGTCYKAANWSVVGSSQGFARQAADFYQHHGKPKTILMYPLRQDFKELLCREELPEPYQNYCQQQQKRYPRLADGKAIGSLMDAFGRLEDRRERKGRRYRLPGLLGVVVCGYFAGCRSLEQCAAFAAALNQRQCRSFGFWRSPVTGRLAAPSHTTLWRAVCAAQPEAFDQVVETWLRQHQHDAPEAIAIDGKVIRATATPGNPEALSVSAISHSAKDFFSATFVSEARTTSRRPSSIYSARSVRSMARS